MSPEDLARLLGQVKKVHDANVLLGEQTVDDAGIYRLRDDLALVQTVDFFPPVINDPYMYGRIAAANSLSDVWAMGGTPVTALNIVGFPDDALDVSILAEILNGGADAAQEAGVSIVGGHTMRDKEIKYGMAVTGTIHPEHIITNAGARPGDRLVLTKPLGTGVITTAIRVDAVPEELIERISASMAKLNRIAAELMLRHGAGAATDITGYGLIGHALEMCQAAGVTFRFEAGRIPLFSEAMGFSRDGYLPGGSHLNKKFFSPQVEMEETIPGELGDLYYDAQTSGGLLIAIREEKADNLLKDLHDSGVIEASIIGEVREFDGKSIRIRA
jgi:selenide,water dikinase